MNLPKIEPCPFCKNEVLEKRMGGGGGGPESVFFYIYCDDCGTNGPSSVTMEGSIEYWNKAHEKPASTGPVGPMSAPRAVPGIQALTDIAANTAIIANWCEENWTSLQK